MLLTLLVLEAYAWLLVSIHLCLQWLDRCDDHLNDVLFSHDDLATRFLLPCLTEPLAPAQSFSRAPV